MMKRVIPFMAMLLWLTGCHPAALVPTYPPADAASTLEYLRANLDQVKTLSAQGRLTLQRADGQSVTLDAAVVAQPPARLRLRAWKFDQAVFDLTLTPAGVWVWASQESSNLPPLTGDGARLAEDSPGAPGRLNGVANVGKVLSFVTGGMRNAPPGTVVEETNARLVLGQNGGRLTLDIDRPTRTLRVCRWMDAAGRRQFELRLDDYREYHGILWPARLIGHGPEGTFTVALDDVEFNGTLPESAFTPPARAVKQP